MALGEGMTLEGQIIVGVPQPALGGRRRNDPAGIMERCRRTLVRARWMARSPVPGWRLLLP